MLLLLFTVALAAPPEAAPASEPAAPSDTADREVPAEPEAGAPAGGAPDASGPGADELSEDDPAADEPGEGGPGEGGPSEGEPAGDAPIAGEGEPATGADLSEASLDDDSLFIRGARVWDGTGRAPFEADILITDGLIEAVGFGLRQPEGVRVIEAERHTVIPGLIDAHVHVASVPGADLRGDDPDTLNRLIQHQLRAYLACGVTTVLDNSIPMEHIESIRDMLERGPGPDVEFLGVAVSPPGGYITTIIPDAPSFGTEAELTAHLDQLLALEAVGVKVTMERGFVKSDWPLHSPEMREAIRREAAARGLPIYVHGLSPEEYELSIDMGAHAMVHPLSWPKRSVITRLRETDTAVVSTIGIADMFAVAYDERLSDPLVQLVVPPEVLATAADPQAREQYREVMLEMFLPELPGFLSGYAERQIDGRWHTRRQVRKYQLSLAELHAAGVKVVVGSDSGNWPLVPYSFHGTSTLRELELWEGAGISAEDTLLAATRLPAELIGVDDRVGTIEIGKQADLLVVAGDPLRDVSALWGGTRFTVKAGVARTPREWMEEGPL